MLADGAATGEGITLTKQTAPRVYISYSTHSPGQRQRVFALAEQLRVAGIDARIDQYYERSLHGFVPPAAVAGDRRPPWTIWQQEQVKDADFVLVMCSREYAGASASSGVWYDLSFMRDDMADRSERSRKFIPAGFGPYGQLGPFAPDFLLNAHYHDLDEPTGVEDLVRRIDIEMGRQFAAGPPSSAAATPPPTVAPKSASPPERSGIFVSYSHRDRRWLDELKTMLSPLIRDGSLQLWDDTQIKTGAVWREEIEKALASSKVAVLLVSASFLASDFIVKNELPPLLAAARDKGSKICWIYVSSGLYERTEIAKYQAAHDIKRPLDRMPRDERQAVLSKVAFEIEKLTR
jgi:hypothetical protein